MNAPNVGEERRREAKTARACSRAAAPTAAPAGPARRSRPALHRDERRRAHRRERQHHDRPQRPAERPALGQRDRARRRRAIASRIVPVTSMRWWRAALVSGTNRAAKNRPISPIGTLTKKIAAPPAAADVGARPARRRAADRRRRRGRRSRRTSPARGTATRPLPVAWIVDRVCGTISAADPPCRTRATTSAAAVGASPHSSEAKVKARCRRGRADAGPWASPSRPPSTSRTAYAVRVAGRRPARARRSRHAGRVASSAARR